MSELAQRFLDLHRAGDSGFYDRIRVRRSTKTAQADRLAIPAPEPCAIERRRHARTRMRRVIARPPRSNATAEYGSSMRYVGYASR